MEGFGRFIDQMKHYLMNPVRSHSNSKLIHFLRAFQLECLFNAAKSRNQLTNIIFYKIMFFPFLFYIVLYCYLYTIFYFCSSIQLWYILQDLTTNKPSYRTASISSTPHASPPLRHRFASTAVEALQASQTAPNRAVKRRVRQRLHKKSGRPSSFCRWWMVKICQNMSFEWLTWKQLWHFDMFDIFFATKFLVDGPQICHWDSENGDEWFFKWPWPSTIIPYDEPGFLWDS